jgi:hypothetical protein
MKINPVNALIAIVLSAVMAYALWSLSGDLKNYVAVGAFVFFVGTLLPLIGGSYEQARSGVNLRVVSGTFFVLGLVLNSVFGIFSFSATAYIVTSALIFLVYVFIANAVFGAKQ